MSLRPVAALLGASLLVTGCASLRGAPLGSELVGRTMRMQAANGELTTLSFRQDGGVRAAFRGRTLDGRWQVGDGRLCFHWPGAPRECWPYRSRFEPGRTRTLTSDRGNVVRVTLQ